MFHKEAIYSSVKLLHLSGLIRQGAAGIQQMRELQNFQAEIQSLHQFKMVNHTLILNKLSKKF